MLVIDFLPQLKANRHTYYNLDKTTKKDFRQLYAYLKKHANKTVYTFTDKEINAIFEDKTLCLDYIKKYKAMQLLSVNINHIS